MTTRRTQPAAWFRDSVKREQALERKDDYIGARLEYQRRESDREYLKESVKLLRRFTTGFEAKDGYALRDTAWLTGPKLAKVKKLAAQIREEQASDHIEKLGRTKAQRDALSRYTGQTGIKNRKRFIVHTAHPETTKVKIVKRKGAKSSVVETEESVPGGKVHQRFFHFSDYSKKPPVTFKGISALTKRMVKDMPDGYYVIMTSNHGAIGVPIERNRILHVLQENYHSYDILDKFNKDDRGLAEVVLGFKFTSFTVEGANREYTTRLTRRHALRLGRAKVRAARKRRIRKRLR